MPWPTADPNRRRGVPAKTAARIYRRDRRVCHVCGHAGADQIDHVINHKRWVDEGLPGNPDADGNLAPIHGSQCPVCEQFCHIEKTRSEARAAQAKQHAKLRRPQPRHPGLL